MTEPVTNGKVRQSHTRAREVHTDGAQPGFCSMTEQLRVLLLPPGRDAIIPSSMSPVAIYTPGRDTIWGKVPCLRKQHDGRD